MAVFRVERTKDYTVMSNYHLRDRALSLKAKGLLSQMLSLPEEWDYTLSGLAAINRESKDAIRSGVQELEQAGYIQRRQTVDAKGKFSVNEYVIYERPLLDDPLSENPTTGKPSTGNPSSENPTQSNIDRTITDKSITDLSNIDSILSGEDANGMASERREAYRSLILENIEYDILIHDRPTDRDRIDELVGLALDTICTTRRRVRVSGAEFAAETVRSRLLKLNRDHILFVLDCMRQNTTKIRNIRQYLLAALYNAPVTMKSYYDARARHDLANVPMCEKSTPGTPSVSLHRDTNCHPG